ncbi:MAG: hypothetical protein OEY79_03415 [Anaplasmataceae bacterium]|nr:hypothetical protein [Anaplasmataceae bacterium]
MRKYFYVLFFISLMALFIYKKNHNEELIVIKGNENFKYKPLKSGGKNDYYDDIELYDVLKKNME